MSFVNPEFNPDFWKAMAVGLTGIAGYFVLNLLFVNWIMRRYRNKVFPFERP